MSELMYFFLMLGGPVQRVHVQQLNVGVKWQKLTWDCEPIYSDLWFDLPSDVKDNGQQKCLTNKLFGITQQ